MGEGSEEDQGPAAGAGVLLAGPALGAGDAVAWLLGNGDSSAGTILVYVRLPRLALAFGVGAALAMAGGALQALLANPLADPFLLGISGGGADRKSVV